MCNSVIVLHKRVVSVMYRRGQYVFVEHTVINLRFCNKTHLNKNGTFLSFILGVIYFHMSSEPLGPSKQSCWRSSESLDSEWLNMAHMETVANGPHLIALERRPHEHHRTHGRHNIICSQLLSLQTKKMGEDMLKQTGSMSININVCVVIITALLYVFAYRFLLHLLN